MPPHRSESMPELQKHDVLCSTTTRYLVLEVVGEGAYGKVAKCINLRTATSTAIKIHNNFRDHVKEVDILQQIQGLDPEKTNVVECMDVFEFQDMYCVAFEMLDMSLWDFVVKERTLSLNEIRLITHQLLVAFKALKSNGIIHTDMKPDNIMLVNHQDQPFKVKLIDFGLAMKASEAEVGMQMQPIPYRAPEVMFGLPITEAMDMWGLGCVLAFLFFGRDLFPRKSDYDQVKAACNLLGQPKDHLLETGLYTEEYFIEEEGTSNPGWRLKTKKEYKDTTGLRARTTKRFLDPARNLEEAVEMFSEEDGDVEAKDRTEFIDLLGQLLDQDALSRITPRQALKHRFVTMTHLEEDLDTSSYAEAAFELMAVCTLDDPDDSGEEDCGTEDSGDEDSGDRDSAPEDWGDEDSAPEDWADGDSAPKNWSDRDSAPEDWGDEDSAPEDWADGDSAPEDWSDRDSTPEDWSDRDSTPENWADGDSTPEDWSDRDFAPEDWADRDSAPENWEDRDYTPENWEDRDSAPQDWADRDSAPENWADRDSAPENWEDRDSTPEDWADGDAAPENWDDGDAAPEDWGDGDAAPEDSGDGDTSPDDSSSAPFCLNQDDIIYNKSTEYHVIDTLGEGGYGQVFMCVDMKTSEKVAIKTLQESEDHMAEVNILQEIKALDPEKTNLVKFIDSFMFQDMFCVAFEMLDMSLWDFVIKERTLSLNEIRLITHQLLVAFEALKTLSIIHADMKPDNIMLVNHQDQPFKVKLIDFGLAMKASEAEVGMQMQPIPYRAPEVMFGLPITEAMDMWGLGCVLAFLYFGRDLFPGKSDYDQVKAVCNLLGQPKDHLLEAWWYTRKYFIQEQGTRNPGWRLKTQKEYKDTTGCQATISKCFHHPTRNLEEAVNANSVDGDRMEFSHILHQLLDVDAERRITPSQALSHSFVTAIQQKELPGSSAMELQ